MCGGMVCAGGWQGDDRLVEALAGGVVCRIGAVTEVMLIVRAMMMRVVIYVCVRGVSEQQRRRWRRWR